MNNTQNGISKIAIISYHSPPLLGGLGTDIGSGTTGGMSIYVAQVAGCLGAEGIDVRVFTTNWVKTDKLYLDDIVGENNRLVQILTGDPTSDKNELKEREEIFPKGLLDYYIQYPDIKPDITFPNYHLSWKAAEALKEKYGIPIVINFHTIEVSKKLIPNYNLDEERIAEEIEIANSADGIIVSTPAGLEDLTREYGADPNKIHIVPPGVNTEIFYPINKKEAKKALGLPQDEYAVLAVGRLDPMKNYGILIEVLGLEIMKGTNPRLYLIGGDSNDEERIRLVKLTEENNVENKVNFIDHMDQRNLAKWYNAADVLVVPSFHETFGLVALEAMACGTPVIASEVGGLQYLVVDEITGYLVLPNNQISLARQLNSILKEDITREKMGKNASEYAKDYFCKTMVKGLFGVFEEIQKSKPTGIKIG